MAYVRRISSTETSIYVDISGLSNPQNQYGGFRFRINGGEWKNVSVDSGYTGYDSPNYTFLSLNCGTSYTIEGAAQYSGTWYSVTSLNTSTSSCPDTSDPSCTITSPDDDEWTNSNSITIKASSSDNVGVSYVNFYNSTLGTKTDSSSPYSATFDISTLGNGTHEFSARAYDTSGNASDIDYVHIQIDRTPPSVSIGSTSSTADTITVNVSGSDSVSGISGFEFYLDETYKSTKYGSSASYTYTGLAVNTTYSVGVKAFDNALNYSSLVTQNVLTKSNRPQNFAWTNSKVSGNSFNLTASEWNGFLNRINEFRTYKGLTTFNFYDYYHGDYSFTRAYSGNYFYAYMFNQAVNAISAMNPPTSPPSTKSSGQSIYASYLNGLRDSLNSIS